MTPEEALAKAKEIVEGKNKAGNWCLEVEGHQDLDDLLCEILVSLGYGDLVEFYKKQERWFE